LFALSLIELVRPEIDAKRKSLLARTVSAYVKDYKNRGVKVDRQTRGKNLKSLKAARSAGGDDTSKWIAPDRPVSRPDLPKQLVRLGRENHEAIGLAYLP